MGGSELKYVQKAFESNYIAPLGEYVDRLEREVCAFSGSPAAAALCSGTAAIHLALRLSGVERGDRVVVSTFTFIASASPVLYMDAVPVFVDSDEKWNMDPELLEIAIRKEKPKAVIVAHIYGQPARIAEIARICESYDVTLIEDAAESMGALYDSVHTGSFGRFGIYSFNGNKIITAGGGGVLVGSDERDISRARHLATQAREDELWYEHAEMGYNYRMSNVAAAIGVGQMEVLRSRIERKRAIFESYRELLGDIEEISFMPEEERAVGNRWLSTLTFERSDPFEVMRRLDENGIESRPLWKPMHLQPLFSGAKVYGGGVSETLFARGLCLPSGTAMERADIERIAGIVRGALR